MAFEQKRTAGRPPKDRNPTPSYGAAARADEDKASAEWVFTSELLADEKTPFRKREGADPYRWLDGRWQPIQMADGVALALNWLAVNRKDLYSKNKAEKLWETAIQSLPHLTLLSDDKLGVPRFIVPTVGMWLEVLVETDELGRFTGGRLVKRRPDMEAGVIGMVPVEITGEDGEEYVPAPIPADSIFAKFLASALPPSGPFGVENMEALEAIQEFAGYTIIPGSPNEQLAHLWMGQGGNGKGVLKALISGFHHKPASVDLGSLDGFGLQSLVNATLATVDETPKAFSPEKLKSLISGDSMFMDRKYLAPIADFRSTARWIINSNHEYGFKAVDSSNGFFRRFIVIEWRAMPRGRDKVAGIEKVILRKESGLVLDWMLIGLMRYLANGFLFAPAASSAFKRGAQAAADSVVAWAEENGGVAMLDFGPPDEKSSWHASSLEVYENYKSFCSQTGRPAAADCVFWKRLTGFLGPDLRKGASGRQKRVNGQLMRLTNIRLTGADPVAAAPLEDAAPRRVAASMVDVYGRRPGMGLAEDELEMATLLRPPPPAQPPMRRSDLDALDEMAAGL